MDKILLVSSSGGHFSELNKINLSEKKYEKIIVTEKNDDTKNNEKIKYFIKYGTRSQKIKYFFVFSNNMIKAFNIIRKEKPKIIISTGAHSSVPFFIIGKIFKTKNIYIESYAKVYSPSLTYKIANKFMDEVIVQHKELKDIYIGSKYFGGIY